MQRDVKIKLPAQRRKSVEATAARGFRQDPGFGRNDSSDSLDQWGEM